MWPGRSRRRPPPDPPPIAGDSAALAVDDDDSQGEDDGDDLMLESENLVAVVATPRPHAPLNGAPDDAEPIASGVSKAGELVAMSSAAGDPARRTIQKSRMELIFEGGDVPMAMAARLKGRKFSTPESFISHGPTMSRQKGQSGGSNFTDLVEEEEGCNVAGFRRTVSTSALRLQNRSLFWKAL
jgi:hypothetical protein